LTLALEVGWLEEQGRDGPGPDRQDTEELLIRSGRWGGKGGPDAWTKRGRVGEGLPIERALLIWM
jgi:hypothetical protein